MRWTADKLATARRLYEIEGLPASKIAEQIGGVTRNAVIGKIFRGGWGKAKPSIPLSISGIKRTNIAPTVKNNANQNNGGGWAVILASINAKKITCDPLAKVNGNHAPRIRNIMNLSDSTCRWPLGEVGRSSFGYCGDLPEQGRVYCPFHNRLAYTSSAQRKQEAEEHARKEREAKRAIMGGY